MEDKSKRQYTAPALEKGFEILELLADLQKPMSLSQISLTLERSKSEIYRMVAALEKRGYLTRNEGGELFHITNKLFDLGMKVPPVGTLIEAAFPLMHKLSANIMQSCHIAVANQERMVVIARVESPASVGLAVRVGHHLDLHLAGSGLVLLANMPEVQREVALNTIAAKSAEFERSVCEANINRVRQEGHARVESAIVPGLIDLSYPIFMGQSGHAIACLTVPYLQEKSMSLSVNETETFIHQAARQLSDLAQTYSGF